MFILDWLRDGVSWILVFFHQLLSTFMNPDAGITWALSIVGLVVVIRIALIPLFVKQIKAQRNLQILQPQMKEIQKKYAGDRERQSQEMMKLYRETGTNPLSSCLPILLQAPIFFALFGVLQGIATGNPEGVFKWPQYASVYESARNAELLGVPITATFKDADLTPNPTATHVLALVLVILMTATTFITQRQLMVKNMASDNPIAQQQKILLYVFPAMFAIGGFGFPIGVLIYWLTTNLWSMGQQFYVIRNNPSPGTPAYEEWEKRKAAKAAAKSAKAGGGAAGTTTGVVEVTPPKPVRQQPKKAPRAKRSGGKGAARPGAAGAAGAGAASGSGSDAGPDPTGTSATPADAGDDG